MQKMTRFLAGLRAVNYTVLAWGRPIALVVFSLLCALGAGLIWRQNRAWDDRAALALDKEWANRKDLGINTDLQQYEPARLNAVLDDLQAAGFRWVRQRFPWNEIEPERGHFVWQSWDAIVEGCAAHQLQLLAVLDSSPSWARASGASDSPLTPPHEVSDWGAFTAAFAQRYRGQVAAYQVWDEPNLAEHWGGHYVDPVVYTALLRESAVQVRQADPGAPVLMAALAPTVEGGPLNVNEVAFLRGVLDAGGRPFFDVVALQPYGMGDAPAVEFTADARANLARLNFGRMAVVHQEMARLGLGDVPIWATSWGWNVLSDSLTEPGPWPVVSAQQQIDYTLDALQLARRDWPWLGPLILYTYQPAFATDDPRWGFAMLDANGNPRSLYDAIKEYNRKRYPLYAGVYIPTASIAEYVGEWRFADAGADPPHGASVAERNALIAFDFLGTALDLTVRRGDFWGFFEVSVDGRPASELPCDENGRSYLILHDPLGSVETVPVARGLSSGQAHRVEIVAHGGWGQWPLVSWTVSSEQPRPPGMSIVWLMLFLAVLFMLAAFVLFALTPAIARPAYVFIGRAFRWYRALPEWISVLLTLSAVLAFYFAPWSLVSLLLVVVLFVLFFLRIDLGLAAVAFSLPFYLKPKLLLGRPFSVVELGLWLCLAAWLMARLLDWGRSAAGDGMQAMFSRLMLFLNDWPLRLCKLLRRDMLWGERALDTGVGALVIVAWLAVGVAERYDVAIREFRVVFLESALFYALIRFALRSSRARQRLIDGWLLGALAISLIGIGQAVLGRNLITAEGIWRVRGLYGSPNNLALYLERVLPILFAFIWLDGNKVRRIIYGAVALPVLAALALTFSKGALLLGVPAAWLALCVPLLLRSEPARYRKTAWIAMCVLAFLAVFVVVFAMTGQFRGLLAIGQSTGFFRLKLWQATLGMIADHPLTGVGLDNFLYLYRTRYVLPSAWGELDLSHPHNLFLDAWVRLGLVGMLVIGWLVVSFIHTIWGQVRRTGDNRTLVLGVTAAMTALLAHGLVDHAVFLVDLAFVFMLLLAVAQPGSGQPQKSV